MCFFFSSRRRHTRCSRDWSSDVCSSDLEHLFWVDGKGWTVANQLQPGDWLLTDGARRVQVADTIRETRPCGVYTLQLHGESAFYANGGLVHDMCGLDPGKVTVVCAGVSRLGNSLLCSLGRGDDKRRSS